MVRYKKVNIKAILDRYGEKAAVAAQKALKENAENLAAAARELAPVETGFYGGRQHKLKHPKRLKESIHVEEKSKDKMWVIADATDDKGFCYARIVEYAPYGKPFMTPAYEAKKIEMINLVKDTIRAAIKK